MRAEDWSDVKKIYLEGIKSGNSTFQTEAPSWEEWDESHSKTCRLVLRESDQVLGWAAISPVSARCVYAGVGEISIYVSLSARGKGIGTRLMKKLIEVSEENGFWTLQAGIFPENASSIKLHKKCGFREVGRRKKIGKMKSGQWRDVILLERRSTVIGADTLE